MLEPEIGLCLLEVASLISDGPLMYHIEAITNNPLELIYLGFTKCVDAKPIVTFIENILLTSYVECIYKQHLYHYF